jgi:hypothetical protein
MKKFLLIIALLGVLGISSQANAGVYVSFGLGGGYCGRGYPAYNYAPGYCNGPGYYGYYGPRYYYGYGPRYYHHRYHHYRY